MNSAHSTGDQLPLIDGWARAASLAFRPAPQPPPNPCITYISKRRE